MSQQNEKQSTQYNYQFFLKNRYTISCFRENDIDYQAICNNGFIKLFSHKARMYFIVQNQYGHRYSDWKFHISVVPEDVPKAYNLISKLFIQMKCRSGMKVVYTKQAKTQSGRQITVYIFTMEQIYKQNQFFNQFKLSRADQHSEDFWYQFYEKGQKLLKQNNIRSNGLAIGDKKLGDYFSLRNQAFIFSQISHVHQYPKNEYGWNYMQHKLPFNLINFEKQSSKLNILKKLKFALVIAPIFFLIYMM